MHGGIQNNPAMKELDLAKYGLSYIVPDPVMHISFPDGSYITVWRDFERTAREFDRINPKDGQAFRRIAAELEDVRTLLGNEEKLAQHPLGNIWRRRLKMSAYEMACHLFEDSRCRAFALAAGHLGGDPPCEPGSYRSALSVVSSGRNGRPIPVGGSDALAQALARFITAHGGTVLTNKTVTRLIIENKRCVGVECADGSSYRGGKAVLSTLHVKHLVDMAPRELWPDDFVQNVAMWRPEVAMFIAHYAVKEPPKYPVAGGTLSPCESVTLVNPARLLRLEFDDANGQIDTEDPPLQIVCPTVSDPSRAPSGMHTLKINGFQPYAIKQGPQQWATAQEPGRRRVSEHPAPAGAEPDRRQDPGPLHREPGRSRTPESTLLARQRARWVRRPRTVRRHAPGARLERLPDADRRSVSDRRLHEAGRLGQRQSRPECRRRHAEGLWR